MNYYCSDSFRLSPSDANEKVASYLSKVIDAVNIRIENFEKDNHIYDTVSYHGKDIERLRRITNRNYFEILKLALHSEGLPINYVKKVERNGEISYLCFFELIEKKGR